MVQRTVLAYTAFQAIAYVKYTTIIENVKEKE
jgi:hypothetical protein